MDGAGLHTVRDILASCASTLQIRHGPRRGLQPRLWVLLADKDDREESSDPRLASATRLSWDG